MATEVKRSRIQQFIPHKLIDDLWQICNNKRVRSNNDKVELIIAALNDYNVDFVELGPGTNRFAVLIDNYVFKIAMDKWGVADNHNEFTMSYELQPHVVKTYECNGIISVCEYVTLISREEFIKDRETLRRVLSYLAEGFLLGDVSTTEKNMTNWGYRDNDDLVILDYAYIYRIEGADLQCTSERCKDQQHFLDYDMNFSKLFCPHCRASYTFMDIRRRVTSEDEYREHQRALDEAYRLVSPRETFQYDEENDEVIAVPDSDYEDGTLKVPTPVQNVQQLQEFYSLDYNEADASYNIIPPEHPKEEKTMNTNNPINPYVDPEDEFNDLRAASEQLRKVHQENEKRSFPAKDPSKPLLNMDAVAKEELVLLRDNQAGSVSVSADEVESVLEIHRQDEKGSQDIIVRTRGVAPKGDVRKDVEQILTDTADGVVGIVDSVNHAEEELSKAVTEAERVQQEVSETENDGESEEVTADVSSSSETDNSDRPQTSQDDTPTNTPPQYADEPSESESAEATNGEETDGETEAAHEGEVIDVQGGNVDGSANHDTKTVIVTTQVEVKDDAVVVDTSISSGTSPADLVRLAQERRVQELSQDYSHLEDDEDDTSRNRPRNQWDD